jgi:hypothetical protein
VKSRCNTKTSTSSMAVTVAERGPSSNNAISPK